MKHKFYYDKLFLKWLDESKTRWQFIDSLVIQSGCYTMIPSCIIVLIPYCVYLKELHQYHNVICFIGITTFIANFIAFLMLYEKHKYRMPQSKTFNSQEKVNIIEDKNNVIALPASTGNSQPDNKHVKPN